MTTFLPAPLAAWAADLLRSWGYSREDAEFIADTLVEANLRGTDSHGVIRLPAYARRVDAGLIDPKAVPLLERRGSVIRVAGNLAAGQIAARDAAAAVLDAARENGIATAVVRGSAHFGTAGYYARWLAERGAVAIVVSNSEPIVVPFGGRDALFGTNPFAFAVPTSGAPLSLDMATSTSAMGRVLLAESLGETIPDTWGVDAEGRPTTDPAAVRALLPFAGPKGYGMGFLVEALGGALSGAAMASGIGAMYDNFERPQDVGHALIALNIEHFLPREEFLARMDTLVAEAHAARPAEGFSEVLVPGEPEERTRAARAAAGITIGPETVAELTALGEAHGVPFRVLGDAR
ncbi:Ldh family oxidoreductase [Mycetocola spongiae]|uniref:Ldh family oxidoreductase n=1 Tax=Mycetocola spongiae TaxID=2859226 RepID=UPI001CF55420|nr:Ldh family oxidoreductase [Mycetocola spongiae]UCR88637.1 Ldh family oxidoreductase [Mycetocola spongiae]